MNKLMQEPIVWHIKSRNIADLKPYFKNPRYLTKDQEAQLVYCIDTFGLIDRPAINLDGTIIGGHQRIQALKKLGFKEIEVMVPNRKLTDEEVEECNIRLNKNTGDWDYDILANEFDAGSLLDWGFESEELGGITKINTDAKLEELNEEENKCPMCKQKIKENKKDLYE